MHVYYIFTVDITLKVLFLHPQRGIVISTWPLARDKLNWPQINLSANFSSDQLNKLSAGSGKQYEPFPSLSMCAKTQQWVEVADLTTE